MRWQPSVERAPVPVARALLAVLAFLALEIGLAGASPCLAGGEPEASVCAAGRVLLVSGRVYADEGRDLLDLRRSEDLCMGCHDGSVAARVLSASRGPAPRSGMLATRLTPSAAEIAAVSGGNHPVGMPYPANRRGFVPKDLLDPRLRLEGGLIGCTTCHGDPAEPLALAIPIQGSALCLACHEK